LFFDENGNFVEVNNALTLMSGYPQEELNAFNQGFNTSRIYRWRIVFNRLKLVGKSKGEFKTP
jgi:PAS domain-containing protein